MIGASSVSVNAPPLGRNHASEPDGDYRVRFKVK
jgi:hypothetical protein